MSALREVAMLASVMVAVLGLICKATTVSSTVSNPESMSKRSVYMSSNPDISSRLLSLGLDLCLDHFLTLTDQFFINNNLDPLKLNINISENVMDKDSLLAFLDTNITMGEGQIEGLASMRRSQASTVVRDKESWRVQTLLNLSKFRASFDSTLITSGLSLDLTTIVELSSVDLLIEFEFCDNLSCFFSLDSFKFVNLGQLTIHLDGLGVLDPLLNGVSDLLENFVEQTIVESVESELMNAVKANLRPSVIVWTIIKHCILGWTQ